MLIEPQAFDLAQLSALAGVSTRTVRYYIQQGLLPSPEARGPGAHYGPEHLDRLRLIRRLQREHLPLAEIRLRIESLNPDEVRRLLDIAPSHKRSSASDYVRGVLSEAPRSFHSVQEPRVALEDTLFARTDARKESAPLTRSQWERLTVARDVELHVRRPLSREQNRQVERLIEAARQIFKEEP